MTSEKNETNDILMVFSRAALFSILVTQKCYLMKSYMMFLDIYAFANIGFFFFSLRPSFIQCNVLSIALTKQKIERKKNRSEDEREKKSDRKSELPESELTKMCLSQLRDLIGFICAIFNGTFLPLSPSLFSYTNTHSHVTLGNRFRHPPHRYIRFVKLQAMHNKWLAVVVAICTRCSLWQCDDDVVDDNNSNRGGSNGGGGGGGVGAVA